MPIKALVPRGAAVSSSSEVEAVTSLTEAAVSSRLTISRVVLVGMNRE